MFRGQFQQKVDAKGRISLPARFREGTVNQFVLAPALFDACLHLYPLPAWEALEEKIAALPSMDPHIVRFRRLYISAACDCEADKAGRILVPAALRERCHLTTEALWAGMGNHLELWALPEWEKTLELSPADEVSFKQAILEQIKI